MPIVVAQELHRMDISENFGHWTNEQLFLLPIKYIASRYWHECYEGTKIHCYISCIFNEEFELINRPRRYCELRIVAVGKKYQMFLDLTNLAEELSLPSTCMVELLAIAFTGDRHKEAVIFPFEVKVDTIDQIRKQVEAELASFKEIAGMFEQHSFLESIGHAKIADELTEGYTKYKEGDTEGSIISYRNAIEGLKNIVSPPSEREERMVRPSTIDNDEKRTEKLAGYLSSVFDLLSNFGQHIGTKASSEEATLSKKLAENVADYVAKKLTK